MDLIDEKYVARLQVRQQRGKIARPLQHGSRGLLEIDAHLSSQNIC